MNEKIRKALFIICMLGFLICMGLTFFLFREDIGTAKAIWGDKDYVWHLPNGYYVVMICFLVSLAGVYVFKGDFD